MISDLLRVLRESIKAVPAMKYALAVAGLLAVVALVGAFKISPTRAVLGAVITLVLMVALVVFARLTTTAPRHFLLPVKLMLWAFLVVTVGTAFLLFTSAFFHWPRALSDLFGSGERPPVISRTDTSGPAIAAARSQRGSGDYAGAWSTLMAASAVSPDSTSVHQEKTLVAMAWIRNMRVPSSATFTSTVEPLSVHLHTARETATGQLAADIHAHIGHANFLRRRDGPRTLRIEEEYAAAVALDPLNPFAHAMWGHWLATQRGPVAQVTEHFQLALASKRERAFVQHLRLAALLWPDSKEFKDELLRAADDLRRHQDAADPEVRRRIVNQLYSGSGYAEENLPAVLSPADHLATFRWLIAGRDLSANISEPYHLARLTEAAGDLDQALTLYRPLLKADTPFHEKIVAGIARCERRLSK